MSKDLIPDIRAIFYVLVIAILILISLKCLGNNSKKEEMFVFPPLPWPADWVPHNPHFPEEDPEWNCDIPGFPNCQK